MFVGKVVLIPWAPGPWRGWWCRPGAGDPSSSGLQGQTQSRMWAGSWSQSAPSTWPQHRPGTETLLCSDFIMWSALTSGLSVGTVRELHSWTGWLGPMLLQAGLAPLQPSYSTPQNSTGSGTVRAPTSSWNKRGNVKYTMFPKTSGWEFSCFSFSHSI